MNIIIIVCLLGIGTKINRLSLFFETRKHSQSLKHDTVLFVISYFRNCLLCQNWNPTPYTFPLSWCAIVLSFIISAKSKLSNHAYFSHDIGMFFYTFGIDYSFTVRCVVSPKYVSVVLMMYARSKHIFSGSTMLHTILNKDWYLNTLWGETGIRMGFMLWKLIFHPPQKINILWAVRSKIAIQSPFIFFLSMQQI